jgi:hypothetical protein
MICDLCGKPASHWTQDFQDLPERDGWKVVGVRHGWCAVHKPFNALPLASDDWAAAARLEQRIQAVLVFLFFSLGAILGMIVVLVGKLLFWW